MTRSWFAPVFLAVLVGLSGCSLLGGPSPTPATPGGSPSPSPTPTPVPYPAGYGATGVADADRAIQAHVDGVQAQESYIVEFNGTALTNRSVGTINALQATNLSTDRAYSIIRVGGRGTTTRYYADGSVYVRTDPPGANNTRYSSANATFRPRAFTGVEQVEPLVRNVSYGAPERIPRTDGGAFFRYSTSGVENVTDLRSILGDTIDRRNVTELRVGIVVDGDGVVRRAAYDATITRDGEALQIATEVKVLGFGSTTVDPPDWLDEARE